MADPPKRPALSPEELDAVGARTLAHYDARANQFWEGTRDHDVEQNIQALLTAIGGAPPYRILDLGCGPGRDLMRFATLGHTPVGLDGSAAFVSMARDHAGCEVLHQDFGALNLPQASFDGIFANASLFHVPRQQIDQVLQSLCAALKPEGVLFSSNPRGQGEEGFNGERYGCYHDLDQWRAHCAAAGFDDLDHYYRPAGKPRAEQPWLATLWRKR